MKHFWLIFVLRCCDDALSGMPNCVALKGRNHQRRTKSDAINISDQLEP